MEQEQLRSLEEINGNWEKLIAAYKNALLEQQKENVALRKVIDLLVDTFEQKWEHAFNESRLTHPTIGFKHKDFNEYKEWFKKYPPEL